VYDNETNYVVLPANMSVFYSIFELPPFPRSSKHVYIFTHASCTQTYGRLQVQNNVGLVIFTKQTMLGLCLGEVCNINSRGLNHLYHTI